MASVASVEMLGNLISIKCKAFDIYRAKGSPSSKWDKSSGSFLLPLTVDNLKYIKTKYKDGEISQEVKDQISKALTPKISSFPSWYKFKNEPFDHQKDALNKMWEKNEFALFMEMRTGKTFVSISFCSARAMQGDINAIVVVCPTGVKPVWEIEMEKHCPINYETHIIVSGKSKATQRFIDKQDVDGLKVLIVGIEALSQGGANDLAIEFMAKHKCAAIIDESLTIKNHGKTRTKRAWALGDLAKCRLILNGNPITEGLENLWSQFRFLDWSIIGQKSYRNFMHRYCVMGGFEGRKIIGYERVDELFELIADYTFTISTQEAIGMPKRMEYTIKVDPSPEQKKILDDLAGKLMTSTHDNEILEAETVLERMTRYQQVVGGHFPFDKEDGSHGVKPILGRNPKMHEMMNYIDSIPSNQKVIIWARFRPELDLIIKELSKLYGKKSVAPYIGGMGNELKESLHKFTNEPECRFFVANQLTGARGIELAEASIHIFYSNSFSLDDRLQAEMRTNSSNQKSSSILYVDIIMNHGIDRKIVNALKSKKEISDFVKEELTARR